MLRPTRAGYLSSREGASTAAVATWRVGVLARRLQGERDSFAYRILDTAALLAKAVRRLGGELIDDQAG